VTDREARQAILDNARYLRNVRPVDPEEIHEYVPGRPHPAVVRGVLREAAFDLGMRERADGTFVPVEEGPADVDFRGVEAFPEAYANRLEDLLAEAYGPDWHEGESSAERSSADRSSGRRGGETASNETAMPPRGPREDGDALRDRIRRLKEDYYRDRPVEYDRETAHAYAVYHLPDYYAAVQYPLADLAEDDLLSRRLRVLDVGAGVGGPALGIHDLLPGASLVEYHAVEPSAAAGVFESMLEGARPSFRTELHRETAESFEPEGEYDLVLFGNVLSELDDPVGVTRRYCECLAEDGTCLLLAPADLETATGLREVERALVDDGPYDTYAPTLRLWPGERPTDRGWSFAVRSDLAVPGFQRRLDEAAGGEGTFVNVDVQYAYATVRSDGARAIEFTPDPDRYAKLADSERHVTKRVDLVALKLSHDLSGDPAKNPLYRISDGSESTDHYAVLTRESALNDALRGAGYGDLLAFENVLVLWNDDESAYNLVVDGETVVDRVAVA
jgi:SAM-dependent methyltransferase